MSEQGAVDIDMTLTTLFAPILTGGRLEAFPDHPAEAMAQVALSRPQRAILAALALADDEGLSETRLASAAGYKSNASANRAFASAGLLIASYLSLETRLDVATSEHDGTTFLGYRGEPRKDEDPGNWILHAELCEAVRTAR